MLEDTWTPAAEPDAAVAPRADTADGAADPGGWPGQVTALAGAGLLLGGAFGQWSHPSRHALHTTLLGPDRGRLTVAVVLVVIAAVAATAALAGDRGWPRVVAAVATGVTVLAHLLGWDATELPAGAGLAIGGTVLLFVSAALATGRPARNRLTGRAAN